MIQTDRENLQELEKNVSEFMLELGIPAHLRGYQFLRSAVLLCVEDM